MPMPTGGAWPPPPYVPAYAAYRDWDAWYCGDPDRLKEVYRTRGAAYERSEPSSRTKPGQLSGGIIGRFSRWLWGAPKTPTLSDHRLHVPLPADLAATSANLLFSEPPKLTAPEGAGQAAVQERLDQLLKDGLVTTLLHAAEVASALGDVYLRPVIDPEVSPRGFLVATHADSAIPTFRWGKLTEVTFWSIVQQDGQTVFRLLEHHSVGRIEFALFQGGPDQLGRRVDLGAVDGVLDQVGDIDSGSGQFTGLDRLDVVRIPNSGPQRLWRTVPQLRYLGRPDFDNNEQLFDRLDEVWTSWMRDVRLAKARITVPSVMLQDHGAGKGASWDPDREIYSQLSMLPKDVTGGGITLSQFAIRHEEHRATAQEITEITLRHAGLNLQTMGGERDAGVATATEIRARERQSFTTRGNRIQSWRPELAEVTELLMERERAAGISQIDPVLPLIEFGDSVSESPKQLAETVELLKRADAASYRTRVQLMHPEWDEPQVEEETDRLMREAGALVEDPGTFRGAGDQPPPEDDDDGRE